MPVPAILNKFLPLSLRRLLSVSMLLLLGTALGTILVTIQLVAGASLEKSATDGLRSTAAVARDRIDQEMYERLRDIVLAAEGLQGVNDPGMMRGRTLIDGMAKSYPDYSWIAVVGRDGLVKIGTKGMLEGQSVAARPWFPQGLKGPFVGDVHEAVLLGKLMGASADKKPWRFVDFALPLTDPKGQVTGVFSAHLNWAWARDVLSGFESHPESGRGRDVFILDKNGLVLHGPQEMLGTQFELPSIKDQNSTWKIGEQWLLAAAPSVGFRDYKGLGWTIVVRESLDEVLAPVHEMRMAILAWSLPMLTLFLIVAMFVGRWIARPLETLSAAAGEEHFLPVMHGGYREIVRLNEALRRMVERLAGRKEEVEREVKARTEEIKYLTEALDAHAIVSMTDVDGNITYVNDKFCDISGYSAAELIGKNHRIVKSGIHESPFYEDLWLTITSGRSWQGQVCNRKKNSEIYWVQSTITATKTQADTAHHYISIRTDITDVINEQEARRVAELEADRANRAKSEFLSSMSHELRTPMNAILGFSQLLEYDETLSAENKDNVHEILKAGYHLLELINEVLDLSKVESGHIELSLEPVEVCVVARECLSLVGTLAAKRAIQVSHKGLEGAVVRADRTRLKQCMLNLLSNAIKYNREGGSVMLTIARQGQEQLRIQVTDTGPGIAAHRLAELFQPFHRLDAEMSEIEGTGIGLTITRRLVEMMGGAVDVESQVGVGSTFWIELPLEFLPQSIATRAPDGGTNHGDEPQQDPSGAQHTVLYIEDNPANIKLVAQMLGRRKHIHLLTAHTPELGIELALGRKPELILLDINMPGMNGYQVLEVFKAESSLKAIPVIAVTANAMARDIERGKAAGFADYLTKPLNVTTFLSLLDRHLSERTGNKP